MTIPPNIVVAAQLAQKNHDIPASVTIAQWALESALGRHEPPGSNNPFGIKAVSGQPSVACLTHEVVHGHQITITAKFRKFASVADAFDAHALLLANGADYTDARLHRHDPQAFANALTGHYATDPQYGAKLISIMKADNLFQYDK
jgi:flagellum-specific peptidoglycan hydrolase FlgJ